MLELKDNVIGSIDGLASLESLRTLDLGECVCMAKLIPDGNKLYDITSALPLTSLRTLKICDNRISQLNLADFPKLRTIYADGNRLAGLSRSSAASGRLENLSLRNQLGGSLKFSEKELLSVKRLYLSGE
jgi:Leucine-rich repeat (LRR) protein